MRTTFQRRIAFPLLLLLIAALPACHSPPAAAGAPASQTPTDSYPVFVAELGTELDVFPTVFKPWDKHGCLKRFEFEKGDAVLDIGTGTGVIGLLAARQGASKVVATDINPEACRNTVHNARKLGFERLFEVRQVSLENPGAFAVIGPDEKFDVIVSDPPFKNYRPRKIKDYATGDHNFTLLKSIISGAGAHLTDRGKMYLVQGYREGISLTFNLARESGLEAKIICPEPSRLHLDDLPESKFSLVVFELRRISR